MLVTYFTVTCIISWSFWGLAAATAGGTMSPAAGLPVAGRALFLLGVFAPALVSLALTARTESRAEAGSLARQVLRGAAGPWWYAFAAGYFVAIRLAAALVQRVATGAWPAFGETPLYVMAAAIVTSTPVQAGEEIGWRGYALPRLSAQIGLARASLVIGAIWACWHLPLFFIPGTDTSGGSFPMYLLGVTATSIAMAWLYWRTNGALLLTMVMHAAVNNTRDIVPSPGPVVSNPFAWSAPLQAWITTVLLWVCAAYFLVRMRGARLRRGAQATSTGERHASDVR